MADDLRKSLIDRIRQDILPRPELLEGRNECGNTPLRTAIELDALDLVRELISKGANPNTPFDDGLTCLQCAIESTSADSLLMMEALIDAGADLRGAGSGRATALHLASKYGHLEMVQLLIARGSEINARMTIEVGETPLMEAAFGGHPEVVSCLLEKGADPRMTDDFGRTALEIAKKTSLGFTSEDEAALRQAGLSEHYIRLSRQVADDLAKKGRHREVIRILEST